MGNDLKKKYNEARDIRLNEIGKKIDIGLFSKNNNYDEYS